MIGRRLGGFGVLALAGLVACGGDDAPKPSGHALSAPAPHGERAQNSAPVIEQLALDPKSPRPGDRIELRVVHADADGDPVRMVYTWRHRGEVVLEGPQTSAVLDGLEKGDEIEVVAVAHDGQAESEPVRARAVVGNRAPQLLGLELTPADPVRPGDVVVAAPKARDDDGDAIDYRFRWTLNGEDTGEEADRFDTSKLSRGDRLQVFVVATDEEGESEEAPGREITLGNSPPVFAKVEAFEMREGSFRHAFEASDPDGDRNLRYALVKGPRGLTVDPVSGLAEWTPKAKDAGVHEVELSVADSYGDTSGIRFELRVGAEQPATKAEPPETTPAAPAEE
jgi:hypothetical protein